MKKLLILWVCLTGIYYAQSQTTLSAGDIAFVGYNSDNGCCLADSFCIVVLKALSTGTQIRFTDIGYDDFLPGFASTGEDEFVWTATAPVGLYQYIVFWNNAGTPMSSTGSCSGSGLSLSSTGDQVIALQGTLASPTSIISGIHMNVGIFFNVTNWDDGSGTGTNNSDLPPGLTNGVNAITFTTEVDNAVYNGPSGGDVATIRANINNSANWFTDNINNVAVPPAVNLPVELISFSASPSGNKITLQWVTASEQNNAGFEIQRSPVVPGAAWERIGFVAGAGNSNEPRYYSFTDNNPSGGASFYYRLKQTDFDGGYKYSAILTASLTGLPGATLMQNSPNPFTRSTAIRFYIPGNTRVKLQVFDMQGREVVTLADKPMTAGYHIIYWQGNNNRGVQAADGIYVYRLTAGSFTATRKMKLLR